ncbi:ATP-binding protein [Ornithinimicrobium cerasi]|uniref:ATP-binding protein n=1 Tax=Ornithinimicrobium cerasi TaxID=2248773 RepID=UPI00137B612C|nr:tetratricopeptide repeat protein [Ornithinimicrobium cerasi]
MGTASSSPAGGRLPEGVVTFLFTDIEGSTLLLRRLGDDYAGVLGTHQHLLREVFERHHGVEIDTQGDSFFVVFPSARESVTAAREAQESLHRQAWPEGVVVRVRMGLHTGEPLVVDGQYVGIDVHRAARIAAAGHGGQVLLSARTVELSGAAPVKDLGEHRLKDLDGPEHLYQLRIDGLADTFPPLASLGTPTNVPHHLGGLVGRVGERRELHAMLGDPAVRLVTLTGTGGVGKTRLAAAVALETSELFPDGSYLVDLTSLSAAEQLPAAIATALELPAEPGAAMGTRLQHHLAHRRMLLLLDNFERVLPAAVTVSHLLEASTLLTVLVTSRVSLGVHGEYEFPVDTLSLPSGTSLAEVRESEAVTLFVRRATQARPAFELTQENAAAVAEVCRLLDGLPLAIELAAARTKLFTPQALVRRLDDRLSVLSGGAADAPSRHRTLRAAIDWSFELLSPDERGFFSDLSVFVAGAGLEAIEAVAPVTDGDPAQLLESLVNHSLVRQREVHGEVRFTMLDVLRQYALEVAGADPHRLRSVRVRHADYFLDLITRVGHADQGGLTQEERVLGEERDNLRSALQFCLDEAARGDSSAGDRAVALAGRMARHWYVHGQAREGIRLLDEALASAPHPPAEDEARALHMLGVLLQHAGQADRAVQVLDRALDLFRATGDREREASSLNSLGAALRCVCRPREAEERLRESAVLQRELDRPGGLINVNNNLGILLVDQGRTDQARRLFADNLVLDRGRDDVWGAACSMLNLALTYVLDGDVGTAGPLLDEALRSFLAEDDPDGAAETIETCVGVAVTRGLWAAGVRLAAVADAARRREGLVSDGPDRVFIDRWTDRCREELTPQAFARAWAEGSQMTLAQAAAFARRTVLPHPTGPPPT